MVYIAGIDGGGTKTVAAVADLNGVIVARVTEGPVNPNVIQKETLHQTLSGMIMALRKQAPVAFSQLRCLFAGVSGAGNDRAIKIVHDMLTALLPEHTRVHVEPDTVNALYAGTYGFPGIVQIAGTGSVTYGINSDGKRDRSGGWGYLFGDEGSGYDIARQGMTSALRAYDGRGEQTMLLDMLQTYFKTENPYNIVQQIYTSPSPKEMIAPFARVVLEAYKQHDSAANAIMTTVIHELSLSIMTLHGKLFATDERVRVVLSGGIFQDKEVLPPLLEKELQRHVPITIINPRMAPVGGSIIGAMLMADKQPDASVIQSILST